MDLFKETKSMFTHRNECRKEKKNIQKKVIYDADMYSECSKEKCDSTITIESIRMCLNNNFFWITFYYVDFFPPSLKAICLIFCIIWSIYRYRDGAIEC